MTGRERSLDLLRGVVMILMTIDHTQEYQAGPGRGVITDPMSLDVTNGSIFVFRILSHFCAPVFTLLMGISAYLRSRRYAAPAASHHLAIRGLVLLGLELTVINWCWTFNPAWPRYFFQIIGALGTAMLCLAAAPYLPRAANAAIGLILVAGHNLFDGVRFAPDTWQHYVWSFLHQKNVLPLFAGFEIRTTYPVIPIVGVAFCGYAIGVWWTRPRAPLLQTGLLLTALFLVLRVTNVYGDTALYQAEPYPLRSLVNVTKYPLSLQIVCMTSGPALLFLAATRQRGQTLLEQFGRTAMFYYIAHLVLIHSVALGVAFLAGLPVDMQHRFGGIPDGIGFPPWATAPLALLAAAALYPLCKWYEPRRWRYL
ncbi:MAG: heparan-alpha-glucosaminide N-acetyltransferase domain-containing protein [Bryobacteraceae bacterium]|nr:heparan-alpha-glucosaminide N-acetyltransferase domain-containing protein [Bryobacteraceae bacterium]